MEERVTWRTLLSKMTHASQERQRLAQALGVNPITLSRWANNTSHPHRETLRALPDALPAVGQQLITLLAVCRRERSRSLASRSSGARPPQ